MEGLERLGGRGDRDRSLRTGKGDLERESEGRRPPTGRDRAMTGEGERSNLLGPERSS
jgi:hypothetical protein